MMLVIALATVALQWEAPSKREDGSSLPAEVIEGYRVYHKEDMYETTDTKLEVSVPEGNQCFTVSTVAETEGPKSEEVCVYVPPPRPDHPDPITIEIKITIG